MRNSRNISSGTGQDPTPKIDFFIHVKMETEIDPKQPCIDTIFPPLRKIEVLIKLSDGIKYNGADQVRRRVNYIICNKEDLQKKYVYVPYDQWDHYDGTHDGIYHIKHLVSKAIAKQTEDPAVIASYRMFSPELFETGTVEGIYFKDE